MCVCNQMDGNTSRQEMEKVISVEQIRANTTIHAGLGMEWMWMLQSANCGEIRNMDREVDQNYSTFSLC